MAVVACQGHKGFQNWKGLLGEILHRRLAHEQRELLGHVGAGRYGLSRQHLEGPGVIAPIMEQPQHPADHIIAEARELAGLSWRQVQVWLDGFGGNAPAIPSPHT
jgi:hypothetical protein